MVTVSPDLGQSLVIPKQGPPKEMISVAPMADGRRRVRINSSSHSLIQECMRKAKYALVEGWRAGDEAAATVFGSAFHRALEIFYCGPVEKRYVPDLDDLLRMSFGHKIEGEDTDFILRSARGFIERAAVLAPLPENDKRSIQNGVWILQQYMKTYKEDPYVAYTDDRGPFVERTFSHPIYQDDECVIETFGTIDFAFRDIRTNEIIVGDHKTTSSLGWGDQSYFDREKPNHQYSGYLLGCQKVYGIGSSNFMVNVIEVKAKPVRATSKGVSFPRQITTRTEEDFAEYIQSVTYYVKQYLDSLRTGAWPLGHVGSCNSYGKCTYKEVCAAPSSLRENILTSKFVRHQ